MLQEYKGRKIGGKLIYNAIKIGLKNKLRYICLGVWEHII
ncbi:Hypothetical protein SFBmNL_00796 [Candidatus Arthromitus sp. SFB-mouse-NL]|nr:Hypothetical protein SFBmNL_00796 [Candidatus Arthromitus sp. SFB-mouse-NL]